MEIYTLPSNPLEIALIAFLAVLIIATCGYLFFVVFKRNNQEKQEPNEVLLKTIKLSNKILENEKLMEDNPEKFNLSELATHRHEKKIAKILSIHFINQIKEKANPNKVLYELTLLGLTQNVKFPADSKESKIVDEFKELISEYFFDAESKEIFFIWKKHYLDINQEIWPQLAKTTILIDLIFSNPQTEENQKRVCFDTIGLPFAPN